MSKQGRHPGWDPNRLRDHRIAQGLTLEQAGELLRAAGARVGAQPVAANFQTLWGHESGRIFPGPQYRRAYCARYATTEPDLGFRPHLPDESVSSSGVICSVSETGAAPGFAAPGHTDTSPSDAPASAADRQSLLGALASITVGAVPPEVGRWLPTPTSSGPSPTVCHEDVIAIDFVTQSHRCLDATAGGGTSFQSALGYLSWAAGLLDGECASESVATGLRRAVAELHGLVGWAAHDSGRHTVARQHLTRSLVLARQINALSLVANILYQLGRVSLHQGEPQEALHLFGLGQGAAHQSGCQAGAAILYSNIAWAYAHLGREDQVVDFLARAGDELDRADPELTPPWARFAIQEADRHGMSGAIYATLARHQEHRGYAHRALEEASLAVDLRQPEERRSHIFDLISIASVDFLIDRPDEGQEYGLKATAMAKDDVMSARVSDRISDMWLHAEQHLGVSLGSTDCSERALRSPNTESCPPG
jgi:tetratricopeptide (TPR) repeat protein